jgi:hypothetical protein
MKHPPIEVWADAARGIRPAAGRPELLAHRAACGACRRTWETLVRLTAVAREEAAWSVPRDVELRAKAAFASVRPERVRRLPLLASKILFSNNLTPALAGVRATASTARQFTHQALYEAGDYSLDLRIDRETGASSMLVVGQILDRAQPGRMLSGVPVFLSAAREIVARTTSNEFGEFALECAPHRRLRLWATVDGVHRIEIPLGPWADSGSGPGAREPRHSKRRKGHHDDAD